jgi:hypothetical protein
MSWQAGTTIAAGTLGWNSDTAGLDPDGAAVSEYNEASDSWDIVGRLPPVLLIW